MILVLFAVTAGLGGAWALTRYIRSMLYNVAELEASTFCLAPVLLTAIVLVASVACVSVCRAIEMRADRTRRL